MRVEEVGLVLAAQEPFEILSVAGQARWVRARAHEDGRSGSGVPWKEPVHCGPTLIESLGSTRVVEVPQNLGFKLPCACRSRGIPFAPPRLHPEMSEVCDTAVSPRSSASFSILMLRLGLDGLRFASSQC